MANDIWPFIQIASSVLTQGGENSWHPSLWRCHILYLPLNDTIAEDTHSGISLGGLAAPRGSMPMFSLFWCQELKKLFKWIVKHVNHLIKSLVDWSKPCRAYYNLDKRREPPAVRECDAERFPQQLSLLECQYVCFLLSEIGAILKQCQLWTPLPALSILQREMMRIFEEALWFSQDLEAVGVFLLKNLVCLYTFHGYNIQVRLLNLKAILFHDFNCQSLIKFQLKTHCFIAVYIQHYFNMK